MHGATLESHTVGTTAGDWEAALDALASARADAATPVHTVLAGPRGVAHGVAETIVVTARPAAALCRLLARSARPALVVVDAPSYDRGPRSTAAPEVLRAAAAGVAIAVVRHGDDLALALTGRGSERLGA